MLQGVRLSILIFLARPLNSLGKEIGPASVEIFNRHVMLESQKFYKNFSKQNGWHTTNSIQAGALKLATDFAVLKPVTPMLSLSSKRADRRLLKSSVAALIQTTFLLSGLHPPFDPVLSSSPFVSWNYFHTSLHVLTFSYKSLSLSPSKMIFHLCHISFFFLYSVRD